MTKEELETFKKVYKEIEHKVEIIAVHELDNGEYPREWYDNFEVDDYYGIGYVSDISGGGYPTTHCVLDDWLLIDNDEELIQVVEEAKQKRKNKSK